MKTVLRLTVLLFVVGMFLYLLDYVVDVQRDTQLAFDKVAAKFKQSDKIDVAILETLRKLESRRVRAVYGEPVSTDGKTDWPVAILGWDFGDKVDGLKPGDHYVLKVFSVDGGEVAFGFSRLEVSEKEKL